MKDFYTISDLTVMSGLSVRTIRKYLADGVLKGEKVGNTWLFSAEQFSAFLAQDAVWHSVQAKARGILSDFLLVEKRQQGALCVIWDYPAANPETETKLRERLLEEVNRHGLRCAYQYQRGMIRAILTGPPAAAMAVLEALEAFAGALPPPPFKKGGPKF